MRATKRGSLRKPARRGSSFKKGEPRIARQKGPIPALRAQDPLHPTQRARPPTRWEIRSEPSPGSATDSGSRASSRLPPRARYTPSKALARELSASMTARATPVMGARPLPIPKAAPAASTRVQSAAMVRRRLNSCPPTSVCVRASAPVAWFGASTAPKVIDRSERRSVAARSGSIHRVSHHPIGHSSQRCAAASRWLRSCTCGFRQPRANHGQRRSQHGIIANPYRRAE